MRELQRDVRAQLLVCDAVDDRAIRGDDGLGLGRLEHAFAEQRRVGVEPLLVQSAQHRDALVEGLARDEAARAEPHAVPAHQALHTRAVGCGEDALPQAGVDRSGQLRASSQSFTSRRRFDERQMAVAGADPRLDAGDPLGEPPPVRHRHETVVLSVQEERRPVDRAEVEAPRLEEGEVVVEPAVDAGLEAVRVRLEQELGERARQDGAILVSQQRRHDGDQLVGGRGEHRLGLVLEVGPQRGLALEHLAELDVVLLAHALEKVEAVGVVWRDRGEARDGREPLVAEGGAGEHVWPAAGDPPAAIALQAEVVGDRADVGSCSRDRAPRVPRRTAVARTVVAEQSDSLLVGELDVHLVEEARRGRSVLHEDRQSVWIAVLVHAECPAVTGRDRLHGGSLRSSEGREPSGQRTVM